MITWTLTFGMRYLNFERTMLTIGNDAQMAPVLFCSSRTCLYYRRWWNWTWSSFTRNGVHRKYIGRDWKRSEFVRLLSAVEILSDGARAVDQDRTVLGRHQLPRLLNLSSAIEMPLGLRLDWISDRLSAEFAAFPIRILGFIPTTTVTNIVYVNTDKSSVI